MICVATPGTGKEITRKGIRRFGVIWRGDMSGVFGRSWDELRYMNYDTKFAV